MNIFIQRVKNNLANSHVDLNKIYLNNSKFGSCQVPISIVGDYIGHQKLFSYVKFSLHFHTRLLLQPSQNLDLVGHLTN